MNSFEKVEFQPQDQLEVIADSTRRHLLFALLDDTPGDPPLTMAEQLRRMDGADEIEMHHVHIPKLEGRGFVRCDSEDGAVSRGPQFDEIEPILTLLHDHADGLPGEWL